MFFFKDLNLLFTDLIPQKNLMENMYRKCRQHWNGKQRCKTDAMYPFMTFYNTSEFYVIGATNAKPKEETMYGTYISLNAFKQTKDACHSKYCCSLRHGMSNVRV